MDKFWVVWNPAVGAPTMRHPARELAEREAERLASQNPRDHFIVLEALSVSRVRNVITEALFEALPF